ncbi:hypothetical protein TSUD_07040 [Trifolium subterraneum]|uniref:Protein BIG GRAIN 1-like B n=1 Tax=Trifolium subterraneum TaxID=3900 RepID=A0A2Z6LJL2_TRISU|nr:hypothetical protein TSUD_07040 [Trifolium subterraneum]
MSKMYKLEKTSSKHDRFLNPSFSSTLLDQIYRSIDDDGGRKSTTETTKFFREQKPTVINKLPTDRKHNNNHNNKPETEKTVYVVKTDNRRLIQHDHDQDALFFSSTSISSDSSSGGFSSSDTDSLYGTKSRASSCFIPPRPKPVKTSASFRFENEKEKQGNRVLNGLFRSSETKPGTENRGEEVILIKNKSRAVKIYNNLKKVKQPISPGGKLTSFLNSLFNNNEKKTKTEEVKKKQRNTWETKDGKVASTCSSASSFSRSCLSKTASFCHRDSDKTARLYGVEDRRAKVEEATRKFLNEYHCYNYKKKNDLVLLKDLCVNLNEEDEDVASCASSDLFELDHLNVLGDDRYCEELPVFGTTRVN